MNGAQDLGGMMGFGPLPIEPDEPLFHAAWEKRALALTIAAGACRLWTIDESRHARESLPPADYLSKSYYDIWITALARLALRTGLATRAELDEGRMLTPPRTTPGRLEARQVAAALAAGSPCDREATTPALFGVGDEVAVKVMHPTGHTRLPGYARGKRGRIEAVRGVFVFPDAHAHGRGESPCWLYTVRFAAAELWGPAADPRASVAIDAFEPYLDAV